MSRVTKEINKITGTVIGISGRLILYALVVLLLVEGMSRGYAFGHDIFYATSMEEAPGTDMSVTIPEKQSDSETASMLKDMGLIKSNLAMLIQMKFYDYEIYPGTYTLNTSMTSKEILQLLNEKPKDAEDASGQSGAAAGPEGPQADTGAADVETEGPAASDGGSGEQPGGGQTEAPEDDSQEMEIRIGAVRGREAAL